MNHINSATATREHLRITWSNEETLYFILPKKPKIEEQEQEKVTDFCIQYAYSSNEYKVTKL